MGAARIYDWWILVSIANANAAQVTTICVLYSYFPISSLIKIFKCQYFAWLYWLHMKTAIKVRTYQTSCIVKKLSCVKSFNFQTGGPMTHRPPLATPMSIMTEWSVQWKVCKGASLFVKVQPITTLKLNQQTDWIFPSRLQKLRVP